MVANAMVPGLARSSASIVSTSLLKSCFETCFIFQVKQNTLRKVIGVVPQDTVLFNDDIR